MSLNQNALLSIARTQLTHASGVSAMFDYGAVVNVDINTAKVFEDVCFSWEKRFTVPASGEVNILVDPTALPDGKDIVILPLSFRAFGGGPINIDLYGGASSNEDGTLWQGTNRRFGSANVRPATIARLNPTGLAAGTKTDFEYVIYSAASGAAGRISIGGETRDDLVSVPRSDIKYLFKFTNTSANEAQAHFSATIFEVDRPGV